MKKSILAFAVLAMMATGCKKDDDDNTQSRSEMLVGTWTLNQYGTDGNNNAVVDANEVTPVAGTGISGTATFNSNGMATLIVSIPLLGSDTTSGPWALVSGDNYIRAIDGTDTTYLQINNLTSNALTLRDTTDAALGDAVWYVLQK